VEKNSEIILIVEDENITEIKEVMIGVIPLGTD